VVTALPLPQPANRPRVPGPPRWHSLSSPQSQMRAETASHLSFCHNRHSSLGLRGRKKTSVRCASVPEVTNWRGLTHSWALAGGIPPLFLECGAFPPLLFFRFGVRRFSAAFFSEAQGRKAKQPDTKKIKGEGLRSTKQCQSRPVPFYPFYPRGYTNAYCAITGFDDRRIRQEGPPGFGFPSWRGCS